MVRVTSSKYFEENLFTIILFVINCGFVETQKIKNKNTHPKLKEKEKTTIVVRSKI